MHGALPSPPSSFCITRSNRSISELPYVFCLRRDGHDGAEIDHAQAPLPAADAHGQLAARTPAVLQESHAHPRSRSARLEQEPSSSEEEEERSPLSTSRLIASQGQNVSNQQQPAVSAGRPKRKANADLDGPGPSGRRTAHSNAQGSSPVHAPATTPPVEVVDAHDAVMDDAPAWAGTSKRSRPDTSRQTGAGDGSSRRIRRRS